LLLIPVAAIVALAGSVNAQGYDCCDRNQQQQRQSTGNEVENASISPASDLVKRPPQRVDAPAELSMSYYVRFVVFILPTL